MEKTVLIETSARHVHVTKETLETLFGKGYQLTKKKDLSQPGQFACVERVQVIGPKNSFPAVSILGPERSAQETEFCGGGRRSTGLAAREGGRRGRAGAGQGRQVRRSGEVELTEGVTSEKRHIHMTPEDAEKYGLSDKQVVSVEIKSAERSLIFGDTVVRVSPNYALAMHIDTDESNAVMAPAGTLGVIL